jgi:hypothetical protein
VVAGLERSHGADHAVLVTPLFHLGTALLRQRGKRSEARARLARALAIAGKRLGAGHPETATIRDTLAELDRRSAEATR